MYSVVTPMLHLQSVEQRHKRGSEEILWDDRYKVENCSGGEEVPLIVGLKALEQEIVIFLMSVE